MTARGATPRDRARVSLSPMCAPDQTTAQDLELATTLGLARIALSAGKLEREGRNPDAVRRQVTAAGVTVDAVYQPAWFDLRDPAGWPALQARFAAAIDHAQRHDAPVMLTTGTGVGGAYDASVEAFRSAVEPVARAAAAAGVGLLLEPTRPQFAHVGFVHTLRDALRLLDDSGIDARIAFDTSHCWWEPDLDALLAERTERIGYVQLADLALDGPAVDRRVPGEGDLPIPSLLAGLLGHGYAGPVEIELTGPVLAGERLVPALRRAVAAAEAMIADAAR